MHKLPPDVQEIVSACAGRYGKGPCTNRQDIGIERFKGLKRKVFRSFSQNVYSHNARNPDIGLIARFACA